MLLEPRRDRRTQFFRENWRDLSLPPFLAQIDDAHERHLTVVHALRQPEQPIFAKGGVVITLERRRGGAEENRATFQLRAHDRDIAGVIPWRVLLFVGSFVLFIHHDEPEILEWREDRAPRPDHDTSPTGVDLVPFIMSLAFGKMTVQHRDSFLRICEAAFEAFDRLRRE